MKPQALSVLEQNSWPNSFGHICFRRGTQPRTGSLNMGKCCQVCAKVVLHCRRAPFFSPLGSLWPGSLRIHDGSNFLKSYYSGVMGVFNPVTLNSTTVGPSCLGCGSLQHSTAVVAHRQCRYIAYAGVGDMIPPRPTMRHIVFPKSRYRLLCYREDVRHLARSWRFYLHHHHRAGGGAYRGTSSTTCVFSLYR